MLNLARETAGLGTPILGIKVGGMGFLTAASSGELPKAVEHLRSGDFNIESQALIQARGQASGKRFHLTAINDFVISRGVVPRMIDLEVRVDGEVLTRYRCDGLIVSSPTGSTAYSLAAGGAVVAPGANVFAITPICPHTLSNRSVIVARKSTVEVQVLHRKPEAILSADGSDLVELAASDLVVINRSRKTAQLARLPGSSFFQTLRQKLDWVGSHV